MCSQIILPFQSVKPKTHEVKGSNSIIYIQVVFSYSLQYIYIILFVHLFNEPTKWCYSTKPLKVHWVNRSMHWDSSKSTYLHLIRGNYFCRSNKGVIIITSTPFFTILPYAHYQQKKNKNKKSSVGFVDIRI